MTKKKKSIAKKQPTKKENNVVKRIEAEYPHFRYYKKSKHPALIVGEQKSKEKKKDEYRYRKVMHREKDGNKPNEMVYPNPNPKDKRPMYIGKRVRHDEKDNFEEKPLSWKYLKKRQ